MVGMGVTAARMVFGKSNGEQNEFSSRREDAPLEEPHLSHKQNGRMDSLALTERHNRFDHVNVDHNCVQGVVRQLSASGESHLLNLELDTRELTLRFKPAVDVAESWTTLKLLNIDFLAVGNEIGVPHAIEQLDFEIGYTGHHLEETASFWSFGLEPIRTYYFRSKSLLEREEWARAIKGTAKMAKDEYRETHQGSWALWVADTQVVLSAIYDSDTVQLTACFAIFLNFCFSIGESQMQPAAGSATADMFQRVDTTFALIFLVELCWNMTANFWSKFWSSGWNLFDFAVVISSMVGLVMNGGSSVSVLRLFRALRAFRLFRRIESLRKVLTALANSVLPVLNAFVILALITAIYAIMGVNFFGDEFEEFRDFFNSLFTMFQVLTGDSWAQEIARPIIDSQPTGASAYFVSFVLLASMVLINVMVAILLDEFAKAGEKGLDTVKKPDLDGHDLLYEMIRPLLHCASEREARTFIKSLWTRVDFNNDSKVELPEVKRYILSIAAPGSKLAKGVAKECELVNRRVEELMQDGRFCDSTGKLDYEGFNDMLRAYATRYTVHISGAGHSGAAEKGVSFADFARLEARVDELLSMVEKVHKTCKATASRQDPWDVISEKSELDSEAVAPKLMLKQMIRSKSFKLGKRVGHGSSTHRNRHGSEEGSILTGMPASPSKEETPKAVIEAAVPSPKVMGRITDSKLNPIPPTRSSSAGLLSPGSQGQGGHPKDQESQHEPELKKVLKPPRDSPYSLHAGGPTLARHVSQNSPRSYTPRDQLREPPKRNEPNGQDKSGPLNGFLADLGGFLTQRNDGKPTPGQWLFNFGSPAQSDEAFRAQARRTEPPPSTAPMLGFDDDF